MAPLLLCFRAALLACSLAWSSLARGAEPTDENELTGIEVHAFVSQGFFVTLENDWLARDSTSGSFEFSEVGINLTSSLGDALRVGVQLFTQDLGLQGDYKVKFDWYYLDYRWRDWLGLRVGRLKIPYGLYNEIHDIDAARVPVLLPGSVYPLQSRQILFAHTGAELYGFARSSALGALEYRLFGGTIFLDPDELVARGLGFELEFDVPYVVGGRLLWETPLDGLRLGGSVEAVRLETTVLIPAMSSVLIENDSMLWVGSLEYAALDWTLSAEYSRWSAEQSSDNPMLSPDLDVVSERAYVMAAYRLTPRLQPAAYYSLLFPDTELRRGRENQQHDVAVTLRFDVNAHWLVKLEGHYMNGTAGLLNPLRVNPPDLSGSSRHWGAFFLKTTGHF